MGATLPAYVSPHAEMAAGPAARRRLWCPTDLHAQEHPDSSADSDCVSNSDSDSRSVSDADTDAEGEADTEPHRTGRSALALLQQRPVQAHLAVVRRSAP